MPSTLRPLALVVGLALGFTAATARGDILVDFEDLSFAASHPPLDTLPTGSTGSFDNGYDLGGGLTSHGAFFNNSYGTSTFGGTTIDFWNGWALSNVRDTTPISSVFPVPNPAPVPTDFLHQYGAITGSGVGGSGNYVVATAGDFVGDTKTAFIDLPTGTTARSLAVTNTVYSYLTATQGDSFTGPLKPGDFLTLRIFGFAGPGATGASAGEVDVSLADFRSGVETFLTTWQTVDLSSLAGARSLSFEVDGNLADQYSTFGGTAFLNNPSNFALDNLVLGTAAVPEPSSLALVGLGLAGLAYYARVRDRRETGA